MRKLNRVARGLADWGLAVQADAASGLAVQAEALRATARMGWR